MQTTKIKTLSVLGLSLAMQAALAGNITDINVSTLPNKQKIVKIKFDSGVVSPTGFVTTTPARIALDFPATNIQLAQPVLEYADPLLNQITVAQNNDRARVLLNLSKTGQYNTEVKGKEVWIYVSEAANETTHTPAASNNYARNDFVDTPVSQAAPNNSNAAAASANIDFRKGSSTSGIVELNAPGFKGQPDIKRQADSLTVTLKNYPLPVQAQRNLDVSDFNTPVRSIVMRRIGNDTQLTIRTKGGWDFNNRSSGNRMSFEISQKNDMAMAGLSNANTNKSFKGARVSLDFQDVDVRTILQILAKESGMNIVASDSVTGKMTLTLKDVPWDQALDLVMQARNLDMRRQGNIINVAPREELMKKEESILQQQNQIEKLGPLYSQTFQLKYKNVEEFRKILRLDEGSSSTSGNSRSILSERGSALIDPATNTLIITDNNNVIRKFQKLLEELDVPARQVMVEARIVEANDGFSRELGVKFGYGGSNGRNSWGNNQATALANNNAYANNARTAFNNAMSGSTTIPTFEAFTVGNNINLPVTAATTSLALVRQMSSGLLSLELAAQQAQSKVKVISTPRVLTQDRKEAVIESGVDIPYQEASSSGATSTSFKKAVLGLTVTPNITPDGQIIMDIKVNNDTVNTTCGASEPCINTNRLETKAMVENGGTLILGGIYRERNGESVSKVPLLGDIPVVGNLFKSRAREEERSELLIFLTPRIMDNVGSTLRY